MSLATTTRTTRSAVTREAIMADVLDLLSQLARDWDYSGEITPDTLLFAELGFESIDAVVLASHIQERYQQQFPFPQLLADLGQREVKDMRIGELVEFVYRHFNDSPAGT